MFVEGILDDATVAKMQQPRCGNRDMEEVDDEVANPLDVESASGAPAPGGRRKRYAIEGECAAVY